MKTAKNFNFKDKEYASENILISFRMRRGDTDAINLTDAHDFTKIPTKEEIKEWFGPGYYVVQSREPGISNPVLRKRFTIEGKPTLPVDRYALKVMRGRKWISTDANIPGPDKPTKEQILLELGSSGYIKMNAIGANGKVLWSEFFDYTDADHESVKVEESEEAAPKEHDSIEAEEMTAERGEISLDGITSALEEEAMERLENGLSYFFERLSNTNGKGATSPGMSISELVFKPYQVKLAMKMEIIEELAQKNPTEAMKKLEEMPDGITIANKLGLIATGFIEALTDSFQAKSQKEGEKKRHV